MENIVDITERTLEDEKKEFTLVCKVFEALCSVMTAVFALAVVIIAAVIISMKAELKDIFIFIANSAVLLFGIVSALNFGRAIFRKLKSGETPFRYDIADKVKGASLALLMCGILSIVTLAVSCSFSEAFSDICHYFFFIAIGNIFTGLILGIISYIMNYGCKLQQESDETL